MTHLRCLRLTGWGRKTARTASSKTWKMKKQGWKCYLLTTLPHFDIVYATSKHMKNGSTPKVVNKHLSTRKVVNKHLSTRKVVNKYLFTTFLELLQMSSKSVYFLATKGCILPCFLLKGWPPRPLMPLPQIWFQVKRKLLPPRIEPETSRSTFNCSTIEPCGGLI